MTLPPPEGEPNVEEALDYLLHLHKNGPWYVASMDPDGRLKSTSFRTQAGLAEWLLSEKPHANIYYQLNPVRDGVRSKASKADITEAIALHVDIDDLDSLDRLRAFEPKPTAIIATGGGFQAIHVLREPSIDFDRVERINATIARRLGGDNCQNIDRLLRVPGTNNYPNAKKRSKGRVTAATKLVEADWSRCYSLDDFPEDEPPSPAGPKGATVTVAPTIASVRLEDLGVDVSEQMQRVIRAGDDPDRPRGSEGQHFPSRSEAVFSVACGLARAGCSLEQIAGILINPDYGISASILDRRDAAKHAFRQAVRAHTTVGEGWPDCDRNHKPRATWHNAKVALQRLGIAFEFDLFRNRKRLRGHALAEHQGEISDDICMILRTAVLERFGFDPKVEHVRDAVTSLCLENAYHPIRDMLDQLSWDGTPRIDRWLPTYLGAEDNRLNQAIGSIMLIAAVRRVRQPGVKFDQIIVLEGEQGKGKSTSLKIMAGPENHSDQELLTLDAKQQMELLEGVWIQELPEVEGMNKAEVNKIKAFASRTEDRARPAYAHDQQARPRQAIFVGTTNEDKYLRDQTGNRRFWPVKTGTIDLEALTRDRDQLWAEAALREATGESITLPESLWEAAAVEQGARLEEDPWIDILMNKQGKAIGETEYLKTTTILRGVLDVSADRMNQGHTKRLAQVMRQLGWTATKFRQDGAVVRGYMRPKSPDYQEEPEI